MSQPWANRVFEFESKVTFPDGEVNMRKTIILTLFTKIAFFSHVTESIALFGPNSKVSHAVMCEMKLGANTSY